MAGKTSVALIDGDIIVYRCGFAAEQLVRTLKWDGKVNEFRYKKDLLEFIKENNIEEYELEEHRIVEPLDYVLATVRATVSGILSETRPKDYRIFLTEGEGYRSRVATIAKYKGNRDNMVKPRWYDEIRNYLIKYYEATVVKDIEADDALAREQTEDSVICSIDKDLLQVPGKHFNWVTGIKLKVAPETALRNKWIQVLTGDTVDNIPGIKGIGKITAKKLLDECTTEEEMRSVCVAKWAEYLANSPPDWVQGVYQEEGDPIECKYTCANWNETTSIKSADDVVDEILTLIKVG